MEQKLLRAIEELQGAVHSVDTRSREIDEQSRKMREVYTHAAHRWEALFEAVLTSNATPV